MNSQIQDLQKQFVRGEARKEGTGRNRRVVFSDGSIWFPEGAPVTVPAQAALPALFGLLMVSGLLTALAWNEGSSWRWIVSAVALCALLGMILVGRNEVRRSKEAERNLREGLFLIGDELVLRDNELFESFKRSAISRFLIRFRNRGEEKSQDWIHIIVAGNEDRDVPTDLTAPALPVLEGWLAGSN